ncbi:MAG: ferrous iron transport protein B [Paludibacteraceae bacterium]|nr:ferrous iron transport protein B [Paludibacteraceae bacterium]
MRLSDLKTGEKAVIVKVFGNGGFRKRIIEMGFVRGAEVQAIHNAPLQDPVEYHIMDYNISLRRSEGAMVEVMSQEEFEATFDNKGFTGTTDIEEERRKEINRREKEIKVALVGNPNCGKTSLFNVISHSTEHVGNYSGVTVEAKEGHFDFQGYHFTLVDLPGTYSLDSYSPEEIYVRKNLVENTPDVILNVVDASNLERNLYLTTQLIDMNMPMVIALNMYDELQQKGDKLDHEKLGLLLGVPFVPTIGRSGKGIDLLFHMIINIFEGSYYFNEEGGIDKEKFLKEFENNPDKHKEDELLDHTPVFNVAHHIHIHHGAIIEEAENRLQAEIKKNQSIRARYSTRFLAIKLVEGDREVQKLIAGLDNAEEIFKIQKEEQKRIAKELNEDPESAVTNARYGFIAGALGETFEHAKEDGRKLTKMIDRFVTDKYWGYPIFLLFISVMFWCTFSLGAYPMEWIDKLVSLIKEGVAALMPDGILKDLVVDGIIGGVGGVIVFLPNILILYSFISFMEDSGYMARAAFIMDKVMHKMGLHGKSFIPLIMGFGCNVPAVMGTRIIESRKSRIITIMVLPFMSCSARIPIYTLFAVAFFPKHPAFAMFSLYFIGVFMAFIFARVFRFFFKEDEAPFVLELPPYRMPTGQSVLVHVWDKTKEYLKKMGGVILIASIAVWFLEYFPRDKQLDEMKANLTEVHTTPNEMGITPLEEASIRQKENSYIGQIGQAIEPVVRPLGFTWQMGVSLLAGSVAKEVVVSTMNVLYTGNTESGIEDSDEVAVQKMSRKMNCELKDDGTHAYTPLSAFAFLVFVLLYFPCAATLIAIKNEAGSWKWSALSMAYTCTLAWVVSFLIFQIGTLLGLGC